MTVGDKSLWFLRVGARSASQFSRMLPGTNPVAQAPTLYRSAPRPAADGSVPHVGRPAAAFRSVTAEQAVGRGVMFAGNPDTVYRQIMDFYDKVGGFEHLILMGRSGFMTHEEAEKGIRMFAREVLPRLKEVVHQDRD
jgi:alkanesulfonate monooxygenase SsuD/methylene tetrahydromethanopterin reductase-like flavin-dependent oxidoreductase (luciferase family)